MLGEKDQRYNNELCRIKEALWAVREGLKKKDTALIKKGLLKGEFALNFLWFAHNEHLKADEKIEKTYKKHMSKVKRHY